jgi:hypothetical protein
MRWRSIDEGRAGEARSEERGDASRASETRADGYAPRTEPRRHRKPKTENQKTKKPKPKTFDRVLIGRDRSLPMKPGRRSAHALDRNRPNAR